MSHPFVQKSTAPVIHFRPSSLTRRLAGLIYDLVAVVAIVMVVGLICQAATMGQLVRTDAGVVIAWWYRPLQYVVVVAYFVVSWLRGGQTLGMRPWRMRLRTTQGRRIHWKVALVRAAVVSLPLLLLSLGDVLSPRLSMLTALGVWVIFYAVALVNPRRRALHDMVAGTEIVHMVMARQGQRRESMERDAESGTRDAAP